MKKKKSKEIKVTQIIKKENIYTIEYKEGQTTENGTMNYDPIPWQHGEKRYKRIFMKSDGTILKEDTVKYNEENLTNLPEPFLPEINIIYLNTNYELTKQFTGNNL